jgi:uncharacterized protein YicC (UPF0701 family)
MVHSMTAFARAERAGTQGTLSWELRSVNQPLPRAAPAPARIVSATSKAPCVKPCARVCRAARLECTLRFTEETTGKPLQVDRERASATGRRRGDRRQPDQATRRR